MLDDKSAVVLIPGLKSLLVQKLSVKTEDLTLNLPQYACMTMIIANNPYKAKLLETCSLTGTAAFIPFELALTLLRQSLP